MSELINLRHMEADGATISMIPNIERLTALQELKEFHVKKEKGHGLEQLKNLVSLRGTLHIGNLENISTTNEANEAMLNDKSRLRQLWLEWSSRTHAIDVTRDICNSDSEELVLDGFQPPPNITHLGIKWYGGSRVPVWMQPNCFRGAALQTLVLDHCVFLQSLPHISQLFPYLREIELKYCHQIRYLPRLPTTLVRLILSNCRRLALLSESGASVRESPSEDQSKIVAVDRITTWLKDRSEDYSSSKSVMQNIDILVSSLKKSAITEIEKENKMPLDGNVQQLPSSLQHLELHQSCVDDTTLYECLSRLSSLTSVDLFECVCITSLPSGQVLCQLGLLQELKIKSCLMLTSLGGLAELASLKTLEIVNSPNLMRMLPADHDDQEASSRALLPKSLIRLKIMDCGLLDTHLARCLTGLTSLARLTLVKCEHMESFPPVNDPKHRLTSLKFLQLQSCKQLVSLGDLHALAPSLSTLAVYECPGLHKRTSVAAAEDGLSSLFQLTLDDLSLLPSLLSGNGLASLRLLCLDSSTSTCEQDECLKQLISLKQLKFANCERLSSLPGNLESLTCLKYLGILKCPQVKSLQNLPRLLEVLDVVECHPELKQSCQEGTGRHWDLIKNIPTKRII